MPVTIRGKEFDSIVMRGPQGTEEEMPFNTHTGFQWDAEMAYRELHSNALDENGSTTRADSYTPAPDTTAFVVEGDEIERAYNMRDSIFLSTTPEWSTQKMDIHRGGSQYAYYRGVRVFKLSHPSLFTYNLRQVNYGITEDRTLGNALDVDMAVTDAIATLDEPEYLHAVLIAPDTSYENRIHSWLADSPGDPFVAVYSALRSEGHVATLTSLANATYLRKHKTLPLPDPIQPTRLQQIQLDKAIGFCKRAGWDVDCYPIVIVPHAHGGLIALAQDNKIILTIRAFESGTQELAGTLLEEWIHLKTLLRDCTREMQTHLFRQLIVAKCEALGEAL